jgi:hypothetical protein
MPEFPLDNTDYTNQPHQHLETPASLNIPILLAGMVVSPRFQEAILTIPTDQPDLDLADAIHQAAQHITGETTTITIVGAYFKRIKTNTTSAHHRSTSN